LAILDGQAVNAQNSNAAWVSRLVDTDTVGKVDLKNDAHADVLDAQRELNSLAQQLNKPLNQAVGTKVGWASNSIGNSSDFFKERIDNLQTVIESNQSEATTLRTLSGTSAGDTNHGTFTGSTISDNPDTTQALQELETAVEGKIDASNVVQFEKFTVSHTAFQTAANVNDVELFSLPAKGMVMGFILIVGTSFSGGNISDYVVRIGVGGDTDKFVFDFDVTQAADSKKEVQMFLVENVSAATSIRIEAESTGDTLDATTQGEVEVHVLKGGLG